MRGVPREARCSCSTPAAVPAWPYPRRLPCWERTTSIVTRQSTDVTAISDPVVAKAMQFIREHACEGIDVGDVLRHMVVSRSKLQIHFRNCLNRTIYDLIVGVRVARVKRLLGETKASLTDVAEIAGFKHLEHMCEVFKRRTGWTPGKYRIEHSRQPGR